MIHIGMFGLQTQMKEWKMHNFYDITTFSRQCLNVAKLSTLRHYVTLYKSDVMSSKSDGKIGGLENGI
jgi:hypothetical protein